ncbi:MAG: hypothetical protein GWN56_07475 [Nitrosopumilaceae archaeon]|nr:hypothetical protein [Nitrosopumilaceae archaeon]
MSNEALMGWGWRIPFLLGALTGVAAIFLRKIIQESDIFKNLKNSGEVSKSPVRESLIKYWRPVLVVLAATIMFAVSFYFILSLYTLLPLALDLEKCPYLKYSI